MNRKTLFIALLLATVTTAVAKSLVVTLADGTEVYYPIGTDKWPVMTVNGEQVKVYKTGAFGRQLRLVEGDNRIEDLRWEATDGGRAWINKTQYLGNVSALAWNAYIGGYQPAQKWLKDRKGRTLGFNDIMHYGRILYALEQTDRIMKEIDA